MTAVDPWGTGQSSGLSSSLGSSPAPTASPVDPWGGSSTTGTVDPWAASQAPAQSQHHTGWFGSWTNPFGLVSAYKNTMGGLASSLGKIEDNAFSGLTNTLTGHIGNALAAEGRVGQSIGDFGGGMLLGAEQLGTVASQAVRMDHVVNDDLWRPLNRALAMKDEHGDGTWDYLISPEMAHHLYGEGQDEGKGYAPENFTTMARNQGLGAAALTTAAEASMVVGPVTGVMGAYAGGLEEAAAAAEEAGAVQEAASLTSRSESINKLVEQAHIVHQVGRWGYNPLGATGALVEDVAGGIADRAYAGEGEAGMLGKTARAAEQVGGVVNRPFSSPLKFVGIQADDLLQAMRLRAHPADLPAEDSGGATVPPEAAGPQEATQGVSETMSDPAVEAELQGVENTYRNAYASPAVGEVTPETLTAVRDAQAPQTAAAESLGSSVQDPMADLNAALAEAVAHVERTGTATPAAEPEPNVYEIGPPVGDRTEVQAPAVAAAIGEPDAKVGFLKGEGDQPHSLVATVGDKTVGHIEWDNKTGEIKHVQVDTAYQRKGVASALQDTADQMGVAKTVHSDVLTPEGEAYRAAREAAPKAEPKVEPDKYNVTKGQPYMPVEEKAAADEALRNETAAARDAQTPQIHIYDQAAQRMQEPTPRWAEVVAESVPQSVAKVLGKLGGFTDEIRVRNVTRALEQSEDASQKFARTSSMMQAVDEAANSGILGPAVSRSAASDMLGQELHARINGEAALGEWLKNHDGMKASAEQEAKLRAAARGPYKGITPEVWDSLTPEQRVTVEKRLEDAVAAYKAEAVIVRQRLLATRYGAKGLEEMLLHPDELGMTKEQTRLYNRSERDLRFAEKARERVVGERTALEGKAAKAEAMGERKWSVVDRLRKAMGLNESTTAELYRGIPDGMANDARRAVAAGMDAFAAEGHAYIDPAPGTASVPEEGIFVPMALQGEPVPLADWATQGPEAIKNAILFPMNNDGGTYVDPVAHYQGNARLAINTITMPDGTPAVQITMGMHSINGEAIVPWQAAILGDAHGIHAGFDFASGEQVPFADNATATTVAQHYISDVLNPKSELSRWAKNQSEVATEIGAGPEEFNSILRGQLMFDQVMAQRPNRWVAGDIFKTEAAANAVREPSLPYLMQTIMPELKTLDHFHQALITADYESVNKALAWYYTSHQAIEDTWRYNEDGTEKMTPWGRSAAETFYDLIAITSVMASPTQNLGRSLAAFANLDEFLQTRQDALDNATKVMEEVMGNRPNDVVYVKNVNVSREDYIARKPQEKNETKAAFEKRVRNNIEREVGKGEGTAISRRWLGSIGDFERETRKMTHQTSMTTSPKYRIIDVLMGKFDLSTATAEDIGKEPEWWVGSADNYSDRGLKPDDIIKHAQLLGIDPSGYAHWAAEHANLVGAKMARDTVEGRDYVAPITDSEDVQRKKAQEEAERDGVPLLGGRRVSLQEHLQTAAAGRAFVESSIANSTPHVLDTPELRQAAYDAILRGHSESPGEWGGATVDAHTGVAIPENYRGDTYAVTARLKGMKTVELSRGAPEGERAVPNRAEFDKAYTKALKTYAKVLNGDGAHLGIFDNPRTGNIEIDPVYHTTDEATTDAVGTYTHAIGGAYHFASGYGYWLPHVADEYSWSSKDAATKAVAASKLKGQMIAKDPGMRQAYENALMEHHGSGLLAKLRSFRDNLADPHNSLAVTLDSIMAQLFGIEGTPWAKKGQYAGYADEIRDVATTWSKLAGRTVMPHEVQAALWVYAKRYIGTQDWGRWEAHLNKALSYVDDFEKATNEGYTLRLPTQADLLSEAWKQELEFSQTHLGIRTEREGLRQQASNAKKGLGPELQPHEADRLDFLEKYPGRKITDVNVDSGDGTPEHVETRNETYYDANTLRGKEAQYIAYLTKVAGPVRTALHEGNFEEARSLLREYVVGRQGSMLAGMDGDAFDQALAKGAKDEASVTYQSLKRLAEAHHIPHPNVEGLNANELMASFGDYVRGVTLTQPNALGRIMIRLFRTADWTTLLHENLHAFRLMAPGDEVAQFSEMYPHIQDAEMTPERRAAEERFVSDFMDYVYQRAKAGDPRLSPAMRSQVRYNGPLKGLFNNVADAVDEYARAFDQTPIGASLAPNIRAYWDSIFNQEIVKPDTFHDPLSANYADENKGVNPKQLRGESDFNFVQRTRQYGESRQRQQTLAVKAAEATRRAQAADTFANKMKGMLLEGTKSELRAQALTNRARDTFQKIDDQLGNPKRGQIPKAWVPFTEAIDRIAEEAKLDPSMAPLLDEIPQNFAKTLELAASMGFQPEYIPEMTWQMAQRWMFGHLTLGANAEESSMRKLNKGELSRAGISNRSMEVLGSATVMSMRELLQSHLASFIEENYARQWRAGVEIPDGWKPWSATRDAILTGKNIDGKNVAAYDTLIVPDAVHNTLIKMQGRPVDMPLRTLFKGGPTTVWKNLILTYSPTWYIKHFIGSTTLAALEGVRLQDWRVAWKQFKADELPNVAKGKTIYDALDMGGHSVFGRRWKDMPDVVRSEGIRSAATEFNHKLQNVVSTVDSLNRAAVYARTIRLTENPGLAASRAVEALGDFGRLSPFERNVVSSIMPFYSFQKAMFRIMLRLPVDHPMLTVMAMQLGLMHKEYLQNKLGGEVPDAYLSAIDINGHLTPTNKLNPLTDSYKLVTPEGIAGSLHPLLKPLAEEAFGGQSYGSGAGMSDTGGLVPTANAPQQWANDITGIPALGGSPFSLQSGLSDAQYKALIKRILKTQKAEQTVAQGGFLATDAIAPKKKAAWNPVG